MESLHPALQKAVMALYRMKKEALQARDDAFEKVKEDLDDQDQRYPAAHTGHDGA